MTSSLRPATDADLDFLRRVYFSTRVDEMAMAPWSEEQKTRFLDQQFRAQHAWYHEQYVGADYWVIEDEGVPVGRLYVMALDDELRLMDIAVLPEHRGRGIGSHWVRHVMAQAEASGKAVRIHVERMNRALSLYERLGFRLLEDKGVYLFLEWRARSAS